LPPAQSPTPTSQRRRQSRASTTRPRRSSSSYQQQQQQHADDLGGMDDFYTQDDSIMISDEHMLTDTPVPVNLAMSESTDTSSARPSTSNNTNHDEDSQARLERVLGEAIAQAPDESAMRLQQLQLRVEVLEAENKYLKLENTQNKTAEQILERSMVLKKMKTPGDGSSGDNDEYFTLEGHKAIVEEIKQDHEAKKKVWDSDRDTMHSSIKKLENRVFELETEQSELIKERDDLLTSLGDTRKAKNQMEQKVQELEQKLVVAEANAAAALASRTVQTTANFYSQDPEEMQERQRQMEMEMEEVHDRMTSLMDAMRAKDMFLGTLSEQVEQHRNLVEEKERELRRVRMDGERHNRDKERLREEIQVLEAKWVGHEGCVTKEEFDSIKRDYAIAKEHLAKETATVDDYKKRIHALEETVDELKVAGMESIELYENSVELNRVAMEAIHANLQDEQHKVAALELEKAHLVKTGADALDTFENTMAALKRQHASKMQSFEAERTNWETTVANLKQEINGLVDTSNQTEQMDSIKQVWDSERQRLNETIERYNQQLSAEQADHQQLKQKIELLEGQAKRGDKLDSEKQQLEEQVQQLQHNYDEQLQARGRYLDDVRTAVESQKKTQNELRRLLEAKEKVDRELELARADLTKVESTLSSLRSSSTNMDDWIKEKQQQTKDMDTLRSEIERLEAQNTMLSKQKESAELAATTAAKGGESQGDETALIQRLKADNKKLALDHDSLKESHKQMETECLKLMDEVEKLHSEGLILPTTTDATLTPEESVAQLERQLADAKRQMEKLSLQHSSEIQRIKEQQEEANRKHQREISSLNRDVTELEGIIEAKIFKEDDLEKALESERKTASRLRDDIMELREEQAAKKRTDPSAHHGTISNSSSSSGTSTLGPMTDDGPYCEICEISGHDLMSCKAVLGSKDTLERPVR
jgi:chromosome segregation ATPase